MSEREADRPDYERMRPGFRMALREDARQCALTRGEQAGAGSWLQLLQLCWSSDDFLSVALYRLRMALRLRHIPIIPALINRFCIACWNLNIDDHIVIREGLCVPHGNVVLAGFSVIGRNATIGPWASIGTRAGSFEGPEIGDDVFVGTHSSVLGTWRIGAGATIAAGSVVTGDVAVGQTVVGVPARPVENVSPAGYRSTTG